jgi:hypothetical protein
MELKMKTKIDLAFWGFLLIIAGAIGLALQQGWVSIFSIQTWILGFCILAAIFFIRYLVAGLQHWGWLFPTCISAALAVSIWLGFNNYYQPWIATPIFAALAIPFLVAFIINVRRNWWAVIPSAIFIIIGSLLVFGEWLPGEFIGAGIIFAIALSFLIAYLVDHKNSWALIPAFILAAVGIITLLSLSTLHWVGALIPLVIALPFLFVFIKFPQNWWAAIPAGILGSIGINVLLSDPALGRFAHSPYPAAILFAGWAVTFGWLWRLRQTYPTRWAGIPAMIAGIVALILFFVGLFTGVGIAVVLIVAGLILIYLELRPKKVDPAQVKNNDLPPSA